MIRARRSMCRHLVHVAAALALTAGVAEAQSSTTQSKSFEILSVDGNNVIVKEADGTREYTMPADFRFTVGDKQVPLQDLKPGMKGKATITTTTTVTPVFVTEVKNGQVMKNLGAGTVIVRTEDGIKMFSQSQIDKRGIRVYRDAKPVMLSDLREGNKLTATFVTERPPQVMTEKEVEATITQAAASGAPPAAPAAQGTTPTTSAEPAAAPAAPGAPAAAPTTMAAPAAGPAAAPAATTAPVSAAPAEAGGSWLRWGALIILLVIVAVVLFRRSGN